MYLNFEQISDSVAKLDPIHPFFGISFLAFKQLGLPIGELETVDIANQETSLLDIYYNPLPDSDFYYVPLRSIGPKKRWVLKRKYSDSDLQKTRTTTFSNAFKRGNKSEWAWTSDYISKLARLQKGLKVPAFHLAVWMFRERDWKPQTTAEEIVTAFFDTFKISEEEKAELFNLDIKNNVLFEPNLLVDTPISWRSLREIIGFPDDVQPDIGGGIEMLKLTNVGPVKQMQIDFGDRLNIITGDNGLGKTFLLDCVWWALSGTWADPAEPAQPRSGIQKPTIEFKITGGPNKPSRVEFNKTPSYSWSSLKEKTRPVLPGIVIYVRVDGSCTIWDPAKQYWSKELDQSQGVQTQDAIRFSQNDIWNGLSSNSNMGNKICNGLVNDWVVWQYRQSTGTFEIFKEVLRKMSPHPNEVILEPGEPTKIYRDDRDIPTLKLPYGEVPVILLSAGMKRIISIAYLLVWAWESHKTASSHIGRDPESKIVLIVDEMEAHLHPRWQRVIVPAILDVISLLERNLQVQLIAATHSPLVMASIEAGFHVDIDKLLTLDFVDRELKIEELNYSKHGSADSWLTSDAFDLVRAYGVEAERALIDAKNLQLEDNPNHEQVREVNSRLIKYLPDIDPFWSRWKYFAEQNGVSYDTNQTPT
ncbi:MAG: ATP-binding protein [Chloroflexi bacterium]|nr:ATP-binding protein [Chloroflexota bacterium]